MLAASASLSGSRVADLPGGAARCSAVLLALARAASRDRTHLTQSPGGPTCRRDALLGGETLLGCAIRLTPVCLFWPLRLLGFTKVSSLYRSLHFDLCFGGRGNAGPVTCTCASSGVHEVVVGTAFTSACHSEGSIFGPLKARKIETQIRASPVQDSCRGCCLCLLKWLQDSHFAQIAACKASAHLTKWRDQNLALQEKPLSIRRGSTFGSLLRCLPGGPVCRPLKDSLELHCWTANISVTHHGN